MPAPLALDWGPTAMRYAEYAPGPALAALVDRFWILEGAGPGVPEPIMPDGRIEIVVHFGDPFHRHHPDGRIERQEGALVVGQMRAPICVSASGSAGVAGIRLRPAAARAVLRCPADEITGHLVDAAALFGSTATLREQLAAALDDGRRVGLLDQWMRARVAKAPAKEIAAAARAIDASGGTVDLPQVARHAGISLRQLERRFLADVGLRPKTFARLARLQRALRGIADGASLAVTAAACGYYDQAHMSRDFARLADTSPAAWRHYGGSLTPLFLATDTRHGCAPRMHTDGHG